MSHPNETSTSVTVATESGGLEGRISRAGEGLLRELGRVLEQVPGLGGGPQRLASELGIDEVLASRLLKAVRALDGMSAVHRAPGPEPLRRALRAIARHHVSAEDMAAAHRAVDAFEELIRSDTGDRSSLEAVLSGWVPEARRDFELRRKQAAYRAISQLKGVQADVSASTLIFWPSGDGERIDVVSLNSFTRVTRMRPGATIHFTSRRLVEDPAARRPTSLSGDPIECVSSAVLPEFCSSPTPRLQAVTAGEQVHYLLDDLAFGEAIDVVTCEVNRSELARYVPAERRRRTWASSEISIPSRRCQFDMLVHKDIYPNQHPDLRVYDTAIRGTADRNDAGRDIDQFDLLETVVPLGTGAPRFGSNDVPKYRQILDRVCAALGQSGSLLTGFRVTSDYPLYGSQYSLSFQPQEPTK